MLPDASAVNSMPCCRTSPSPEFSQPPLEIPNIRIVVGEFDVAAVADF
jgi:hypothetical protein